MDPQLEREFLKNLGRARDALGFQGNNLSAEQLYEQVFGFPPLGGRVRGSPRPPAPDPPPKIWNTLEQMMRDLHKRKAAQDTAKKPADPETRRREINRELDIIRGVVPTPKGYSINAGRIKQLMQELNQLPKK